MKYVVCFERSGEDRYVGIQAPNDDTVHFRKHAKPGERVKSVQVWSIKYVRLLRKKLTKQGKKLQMA